MPTTKFILNYILPYTFICFGFTILYIIRYRGLWIEALAFRLHDQGEIADMIGCIGTWIFALSSIAFIFFVIVVIKE